MSIKEKYNIYDNEYYNCIKDIAETNIVREMENYIQHGNTNTLSHCLMVSYGSYKLAKLFGLNYKAVARAGLLHDFFLYDWHETKVGQKFFDKHGFTHPKVAVNNALKYFELSALEKDIILKHMWPLTFRQIPKYKESFLVSLVDKYCSTKEIFKGIVRKLAH